MDGSPPDSYVHGIFPGKNTGVGGHFLLQGTFLTQGLDLCLVEVSCIAGKFFTTEPLWKMGTLQNTWIQKLILPGNTLLASTQR